jgi:two-component system, response regulator YesN
MKTVPISGRIPAAPAPLRRVFSVLHQRNGAVSEREAAALLDRSASRFRHLFRELTGVTYRETCVRIKLACGVKLLISTDLAIQQISITLGYSERGKFETMFKRRYRLTPAQYRLKYHIKK